MSNFYDGLKVRLGREMEFPVLIYGKKNPLKLRFAKVSAVSDYFFKPISISKEQKKISMKHINNIKILQYKEYNMK